MSEFLLLTKLPDCRCGAQNYIVGHFPDVGTLARCETCKRVYKSMTVTTLVLTEEFTQL